MLLCTECGSKWEGESDPSQESSEPCPNCLSIESHWEVQFLDCPTCTHESAWVQVSVAEEPAQWTESRSSTLRNIPVWRPIFDPPTVQRESHTGSWVISAVALFALFGTGLSEIGVLLAIAGLIVAIFSGIGVTQRNDALDEEQKNYDRAIGYVRDLENDFQALEICIACGTIRNFKPAESNIQDWWIQQIGGRVRVSNTDGFRRLSDYYHLPLTKRIQF